MEKSSLLIFIYSVIMSFIIYSPLFLSIGTFCLLSTSLEFFMGVEWLTSLKDPTSRSLVSVCFGSLEGFYYSTSKYLRFHWFHLPYLTFFIQVSIFFEMYRGLYNTDKEFINLLTISHVHKFLWEIPSLFFVWFYWHLLSEGLSVYYGSYLEPGLSILLFGVLSPS